MKPDNFIAFNQGSIGLAKRFSDYKKTMREAQATGKIRSLVWPSFFEHTADEADRFAGRLELYNRRRVEFQRTDVVEFWSKTMGEHSGFIAHLLDPDERLLIIRHTKRERSSWTKIRQSAAQRQKAATEGLAFRRRERELRRQDKGEYSPRWFPTSQRGFALVDEMTRAT